MPASVDPATERSRTYLLPGALAVSSSPTAVTTILGSCVAVCLCDPTARVGGVNHYLLAHEPLTEHDPVRYGRSAIELLHSALLARGARPRRIVAKVFGGACIVAGRGDDPKHLGAQNVAVAFRTLAEMQIPVLADDVLGARGRKLVFHTDDGSAWVKRL